MQVRELGAGGERRLFALVLETGDDLVDELRAFVGRERIRAGHFRAIGAFSAATLAFFAWDSKEYEEIPVEEQTEVLALSGTIAASGGEPAIHCHCVLGRRDGSTVGGHLLGALVRPTLELFLTATGGELPRAPDAESGLELIRFARAPGPASGEEGGA